MSETYELARRIVQSLSGRTVATAESLTGGLLGAALTSAPGSSEVYRGGVIPYATDLKSSLLDIPKLTMNHGPVSPEVAAAMAVNVAYLLNSDFGVATTGVAGPNAQDGKPVGTVFIAVFRRGRDGLEVLSSVEHLELVSNHADPVTARADIREQSVVAALKQLLAAIPN
jgi:nicotinamide-nucleotide amidase